MSTIEDFENAPVGATATDPRGRKAVKMAFDAGRWELESGWALGEYGMCKRGFTLDPAPAPKTAREALDLAWELAHEVKEGQVIPAGTETIVVSSEILLKTPQRWDRVVEPGHVATLRTLDPLPDPEPDWLDAPAVMAFVKGQGSCAEPQVFVRENESGTQWLRDTKVYRWDELINVVPLYPKGRDA